MSSIIEMKCVTCGRPAKYIYKPANIFGRFLCGIHARRFKGINLCPISVKLNNK